VVEVRDYRRGGSYRSAFVVRVGMRVIPDFKDERQDIAMRQLVHQRLRVVSCSRAETTCLALAGQAGR